MLSDRPGSVPLWTLLLPPTPPPIPFQDVYWRKLHTHGNATFTGRCQHYQGGPRVVNMPGHHYLHKPQVFVRLVEVVHERGILTILGPLLIFDSLFPSVSMVYWTASGTAH